MKATTSSRTDRIGSSITEKAFLSLSFAYRPQFTDDYGIDAHAELIRDGEATGQLLAIQLKSGTSYFSEKNKDGYIFRADQDHVRYWQNHSLPVIVCLCDTSTETVYWQIINHDTAISTGTSYKFIVSSGQKIDRSSLTNLEDLLSPIVAGDRYTIFKTEDVSHGGAKRYSFDVVVNGKSTKSDVATIVRQVTHRGQKRRYSRNDLVAGRWGDSDAHVVWTFVYPTAEDQRRRNYICRSIWIHDDLASEFRPLGLDGENVGDGIIVEWNSQYDFSAKHVTDNTLSKEAYFSATAPLILKLEAALNTLDEALRLLDSKKIGEQHFVVVTENCRREIDDSCRAIFALNFAPFECHDANQRLHEFAACLHNIYIFYSEKGRSTWSTDARARQSNLQLTAARKKSRELSYEIEKIR